MGRSIHNQRFERLWRDLFTGCVSYFYHLFYHLEGEALLDQDDDADILALHDYISSKTARPSWIIFDWGGATIVLEQNGI